MKRKALARALAFLLALAAFSPGLPAHSDILLQIGQLDARIEAEGPRADLLLKRGDLYRRHGDFAAAGRDFELARKLEPGHEALDLYEGRLQLDRGDAEAAGKALQRHLARKPQDARAWMLLGETDVAKGEAASAAEHFRIAIVHSDTPSPELYRAQVLATLAIGPGAWDSAAVIVDQGLAIFGSEVTLLGLGTDMALARARPDLARLYLNQLPDGLERLPQWRDRLAQAECLAAAEQGVDTECSKAVNRRLCEQVNAFMGKS